MSKKTIDRESTIKNIVEAAGDSIRDIEELKKSDDNFLIEAAELWDVKIVYK